MRIAIDQDRLEFFGVEQSDVFDTIEACSMAARRSAIRIAAAAAIRCEIVMACRSASCVVARR